MKRRIFKITLILIFALVSITSSILAQAPEKMSYQAVVRNANNELVVNKQIGVQILITQGTFPPVTVYSETHIATTNSNGLLTLQLGGGAVVSGNFSTIKWENGNTSVSANYDLSGGTTYTLLSTSQLLSVPYAMYAKSAGKATAGSLIPNGTKSGDLLYWNGTGWITLAPSSDGKILTLENGQPVWKEHETASTLPSINTLNSSNITSNSAKCEGFVTTGGASTERGVCYGTSPNPTILNLKLTCGIGTGSFIANLSSLTANTGYYIRAYAVNSAGITYGEELTFTTLAPPALGDNFGGGIVAYILKEGDPGYDANILHGLIISPSDIGVVAWDKGSTVLIGTSSSIGSGSANTTSIIAYNGNTGTYAAKICRDYRGGGYDDWYLPSYHELSTISGVTFTSAHWTSSEISETYAVYIYNSQFSTYKTDAKSVRAVRSF